MTEGGLLDLLHSAQMVICPERLANRLKVGLSNSFKIAISSQVCHSGEGGAISELPKKV